MNREWKMGVALATGLLVLAALVSLPSAALAGPWGKLVTEDGKKTFELAKSTIVVGTHKRSNVVVRHPTVASKHLKITHKAGIVTVTDLGSRTGTLVAGTELKKGQSIQLYQRTLLSLGAYSLYFEWGDRGKLIKPLRSQKEPPATAGKASPKGAVGAKPAKGAKGANKSGKAQSKAKRNASKKTAPKSK
jgi:hypothetical protein